MSLESIKNQIVDTIAKFTGCSADALDVLVHVQTNSNHKAPISLNVINLNKLINKLGHEKIHIESLTDELDKLDFVEKIDLINNFLNISLNKINLVTSTCQGWLNYIPSQKLEAKTVVIHPIQLHPRQLVLDDLRTATHVATVARVIRRVETECVRVNWIRDDHPDWTRFLGFAGPKLADLMRDGEGMASEEDMVNLMKEFGHQGVRDITDEADLSQDAVEQLNNLKRSVWALYKEHLDMKETEDEQFIFESETPQFEYVNEIIDFLKKENYIQSLDYPIRLQLNEVNLNMPVLIDENGTYSNLMKQFLLLIHLIQTHTNASRLIWSYRVKSELVANQLRYLVKLTRPKLVQLLNITSINDECILDNIQWYPIGTSQLAPADLHQLDEVASVNPLFDLILSTMRQIIEEDAFKLHELEAHQIALDKVYNLDNLQSDSHSSDYLLQTSQALARSNLIVQLLNLRANKPLSLALDAMMTTKGSSGVYFQYTYARICGIQRKASVGADPLANFELIREPEAIQLAAVLGEFSLVVRECYASLEPLPMAKYVFRLCKELSNCNRLLRVKGITEPLARARWTLLHCVQLCLAEGFALLGIDGVEKM